ncbi:hypothetical protein L3X38_031868 [Prunus dulcis]|uniref:RNase H type-1 domain-containing protein n=1 Tax=Prunus dulcis TaxID=3755 RepID=A0AAD4VE28_PRUDU|nr:hypothetical protein L3X38_031868 [Prunus dulcis]
MGSRFRIGDGKSARILGDRWVPRLATFAVITLRLHGMEDTKVSELICNEGSPQWDLQKLNNLFLPVDVADIARIPLRIRPPPDRIVWHYDNHGVFTLKSAYRVALQLTSGDEDGSSSSSADNNMQELCLFCGDATESALHVLVMCPFAVAAWDISMLTRHAHQGVERSPRDEQDAVKWAALPSGRLKLNFDGAFDPTSGRVAVGVVARDADGGDSAVVVAAVKRAGQDYSNIGPIVEDVKHLQKQFPGSVFQFTHREANGVAHQLARFGLHTVDNFTWFEVPPDLIQDALLCDLLSRGQAYCPPPPPNCNFSFYQ